jgi:amino-acid N-acetyltransferase
MNSAIAGTAIRAASAEDLPAIEDLLREAKLPVDGVKDLIALFVVAENDGHVVGVAGVERCGDYGLLRSAAVDLEMRGRGLGRLMIDRLIVDSETNGLRELYLLTTTAENYFPSFGFEKVPREAVPHDVQQTAEFRDLCPSSATVMRRSLSAEAGAPD